MCRLQTRAFQKGSSSLHDVVESNCMLDTTALRWLPCPHCMLWCMQQYPVDFWPMLN